MADNTRSGASICYSRWLFCNDLPADSPLLSWLEEAGEGVHTSPNGPDRQSAEGLLLNDYLHKLAPWRGALAAASVAYMSIAYIPGCQLAECTTLLPAETLKLLAACGLGFELAAYPNSNGASRFDGEDYFIVAAEGGADATTPDLPPAIGRTLRARGRQLLGCHDGDLSFAEPEQLIARYMTPAPSLLSLNKYLGSFAHPIFWLTPGIIAALAAQGSALELHISLPQRRGKRVQVTCC